jgi:drug/metabolite transporter (DMT)-like permease
MFIILLMYALTTLPLSKLLLSYTQPLYLIGLRMSIAGVLLLAYYWFTRSSTRGITRAHIGLFAQAALFAILIPYFLRYWGLMHAVTPRADIWYMTGPIITYALATWRGIESITWAKTGALCLGYIGLFISMGKPLHAYIAHAGEPAELAIIASVMSFAYGWYLIRHLMVAYDYSPALVHGVTMFPAGIGALGLAALLEPMTVVGDGIQFMLMLAAVILVSNITTHTLYATLLNTYSLTFVQLCSFSLPVFMQLRDGIFGIAPCSPSLLQAAPCIVGSIMLFYYAEQAYAQTAKRLAIF